MLQLLTREVSTFTRESGRGSRERPTLCLTWTLDPQTGKPVGRWIIEATEPTSLASAA